MPRTTKPPLLSDQPARGKRATLSVALLMAANAWAQGPSPVVLPDMVVTPADQGEVIHYLSQLIIADIGVTAELPALRASSDLSGVSPLPGPVQLPDQLTTALLSLPLLH